MRIAVIVSKYNWSVTGRLLQGAQQALASHAAAAASPHQTFYATGAFELVPLAFAAAESRAFDGVVALGCIVKGETKHDEVLGHAVTQALANITLVTGVPVALGVLTVNTAAQARARAGGRHGNKGFEAVTALLATLTEIRRIAPSSAAPRTPVEVELPLNGSAQSPPRPLPSPPDKLTKGAR